MFALPASMYATYGYRTLAARVKPSMAGGHYNALQEAKR